MTDTAATEVAEPAPPAPEAAAAPAPEAELETEVNKSAREKVLDHLTDSEGPQTVAEIIQGTGLIRNTAEQAIFRAVQAGQIKRTAPGVYKLAAPKPPRPPSPEPPPPSPAGHTDEEWIARIEAWQVNPASWNIEEDGPPPNSADAADRRVGPLHITGLSPCEKIRRPQVLLQGILQVPKGLLESLFIVLPRRSARKASPSRCRSIPPARWVPPHGRRPKGDRRMMCNKSRSAH